MKNLFDDFELTVKARLVQLPISWGGKSLLIEVSLYPSLTVRIYQSLDDFELTVKV